MDEQPERTSATLTTTIADAASFPSSTNILSA
jgi:hypothetical protein